MIFERPIPGQSLTTEPKNVPYENPPEIVDPELAAMAHLQKINNADAVEDLLFFLESGVSVVTLTEGLCRVAVMEGIHSLDVSLVVAPVIHEFIKSCADAAGIEYDEGIDKKIDKKNINYSRDFVRANKILKDLEVNPEQTVSEMKEPIEEPIEKPVIEDKPREGLMSRVEM